MRIAVDAHAIGRRLTGNEVYIRSLLEAYAALDTQSEFVAYVSEPEARQSIPARFTVKTVSRNPFIRLGIDLSKRVRADRPDLLHVQYTAPLVCPVPVVVSVHDVSFLVNPKYFTAARAIQLRWTVQRTVRRAARIVTCSEFSQLAIERAYGIDRSRITVIPNAAAPSFRPLPRFGSREWLDGRFGIRSPFILMVGDLAPRKNQIGLIRAFAELVRERPELRHDLVLAGKETWFSGSVRRAAAESGFAERIRFVGFVSDEELLRLYNACEFSVFPSFYEGFGLPVLEAMACGRPVACSNNSAVHEVADGSALLFNPASTGEMARAMRDLALNQELREHMGRLGLRRAANFSWEKSAEMLLDVYREVANAGKRAPFTAQAKVA